MALIFFRPKRHNQMQNEDAKPNNSEQDFPGLKDLTELKTVLVIHPKSARSFDIKAYVEKSELCGRASVDRIEMLENSTCLVHFRKHEDALKVVRQENHTLQGQNLYATLYDEQSGAVYGGTETATWIVANAPGGFEILAENNNPPTSLPLSQTTKATKKPTTPPAAENQVQSPQSPASPAYLEAQSSCFKELMEAHSKLVQFLNTEFSRMKLQLENNAQARMRFEVRQSQMSANMSQLQTLMKSGLAQIKTQHKAEVQELKSEIESLKAEVNQLKPDVSKLRNKICSLRNEISQLQTQLNRSAKELESLLNTSVADLEDQLEDQLKSDVKKLQREVSHLKNEMKECRNCHADTRSLIGLQSRMQVATSQQTTAELVHLMGRNRSLREQVEHIRTRLAGQPPENISMNPSNLPPSGKTQFLTVENPSRPGTFEIFTHTEISPLSPNIPSTQPRGGPSTKLGGGNGGGNPPSTQMSGGVNEPTWLNQPTRNLNGATPFLTVENPSRSGSIEIFARTVQERGSGREEKISLLRFDTLSPTAPVAFFEDSVYHL